MAVRRALFGATLALLGVGSCEPLGARPVRSEPENRCEASACESYAVYTSTFPVAHCVRSMCSVSTSFDYVVVVTVPAHASYGAGASFAIPQSELFARATSCATRACVKLPALRNVRGWYLVPGSLSEERVGYYLGNGPGTPAVLPVRVEYHPLWPNGDGLLSPRFAGLPLTSGLLYDFEWTASPDTPKGPFEGPAHGFRGGLVPGWYERRVVSQAPFDSVFPPDVRVVEVTEATSELSWYLTLDDLDTTIDRNTNTRVLPEFVLARRDGQSMTGWRAFLRDKTSGRDVSPRAIVSSGAPGTGGLTEHRVRLLTRHNPPSPSAGVPGDALYGTELVLEPNDPALPKLVVPYLAGELPPYETYPRVAATASVRGVVRASDTGAVLRSQIVFVGKRLFTLEISGTSTNLEHVVDVPTDESGSFQVDLPRGEYEAWVEPLDRAYAKVSQTFVVDATYAVQAGKSLEVPRLRLLTGSAVLGDGRALIGASIEARPTAEGAERSDRASTVAIPRTFRTLSDSRGQFSLGVDPGLYDVYVQPADGTRFPWVVKTDVRVGDAGLSLAPLTVPAPIAPSFTLLDAQSSTVSRAVVRVFSRPHPDRAHREIARTVADARGSVELLLAGPPL